MKIIFHKKNKGSILVTVLALTTFFIVVAIAIIDIGFMRQKLYKQQTAKNQALHVAEAGANYYKWLLAHNINDYYDGTGSDPGSPGEPYGPYEHLFSSEDGTEGTFSLNITPPSLGSTIVKIESTGWVNEYPNIKRTIEVSYGIPSVADYSFLSNTDAWFGPSATNQGKIHSNGGIRMDGLNDSLTTSARSTYTCTKEHGCVDVGDCNPPCTWNGSSCECPGIWGSGSGSSLWSNPVPVIDFNSITMDIANIRTKAMASGFYLPTQSKGYHIIFDADGTFDVYTVTQLEDKITQLNDDWTAMEKDYEKIKSQTLQSTGNPIPANGLIYIEDDVWVEGTINGKATLVAAKLPYNPAEYKSIIIENSINYLARDGNHILGLIAQKNIKVPEHSPDFLTIDAMMLAQNGHVYRSHYEPVSIKTNIEIYGGITTNQRWAWSWMNSSGVTTDGYQNITSIYDSFAASSPPPEYPNTGVYIFISWEEK